ncbi:hypothetical protein L914_00614 [Phytophthora nicotianae]|uniref:Uncharacterized protein n=1 Tax=Phytophthora nicotianae TaxID=4792 RepID=W2P6V2_PHYNI|nr:hypothetical protein L914_00614 [Phytophthora nicotianae]
MVDPSEPVWLTKFFAAMSVEWRIDAAISLVFKQSAGSPWAARCAFTLANMEAAYWVVIEYACKLRDSWRRLSAFVEVLVVVQVEKCVSCGDEAGTQA